MLLGHMGRKQNWPKCRQICSVEYTHAAFVEGDFLYSAGIYEICLACQREVKYQSILTVQPVYL
jgi:hypothetical protein